MDIVGFFVLQRITAFYRFGDARAGWITKRHINDHTTASRPFAFGFYLLPPYLHHIPDACYLHIPRFTIHTRAGLAHAARSVCGWTWFLPHQHRYTCPVKPVYLPAPARTGHPIPTVGFHSAFYRHDVSFTRVLCRLPRGLQAYRTISGRHTAYLSRGPPPHRHFHPQRYAEATTPLRFHYRRDLLWFAPHPPPPPIYTCAPHNMTLYQVPLPTPIYLPHSN